MLNGIQRNKDEWVKFSWNDLFYLFLFSLTSYSPRLLGRKISSSDNHTQFQTKMFKIYTHFQTKTAQKPYPFFTYLYTRYRGVSPPPGGNPSFSYFEGPLIKILQQMHLMAVSDYLFLSDFFKCKANFEPHK